MGSKGAVEVIFKGKDKEVMDKVRPGGTDRDEGGRGRGAPG
jgi:hypothetical protein